MRGEFLDLSGARIYYYAAGTRGAGAPVVFLHGFPTSGHLWSGVVPLMPTGRRLVVIDLLGYGRSDRPHSHAVDVAAHAKRLLDVLDELQIERACLVGHGIGGGIAQSVAVRHPERVSHLGLVDSVAFDQWPTLEARLARASLPFTQFLPPDLFLGIVRRDIERGYAHPGRASHSIDLYLRVFAGAEGRDALVAHVRAFSSSETMEVGARLHELHVPAAVIWGAHDRVLPVALANRLAAAIPNATLDILPDGRHFTPEEHPRAVADVLAELLQRDTRR